MLQDLGRVLFELTSSKGFEEMQPWLFYDEQCIQNKQSLKEQIMTKLQIQVIYLNLTSLHSPMVLNPLNGSSTSGVFKCLFWLIRNHSGD